MQCHQICDHAIKIFVELCKVLRSTELLCHLSAAPCHSLHNCEISSGSEQSSGSKRVQSSPGLLQGAQGSKLLQKAAIEVTSISGKCLAANICASICLPRAVLRWRMKRAVGLVLTVNVCLDILGSKHRELTHDSIESRFQVPRDRLWVRNFVAFASCRMGNRCDQGSATGASTFESRC